MKSILDHIHRGTYRKDRHEGRGSKKRLEALPEPPESLPKAAKEIWQKEVAQLFEATAISPKDLPALYELVMQVYYMQLAAADLEKNGLCLTADLKAGKTTVANPAWRVYQDAQRIVLALRKEFGLTPQSSQRMAMPEPPRHDPLDDLMN